MKNLVLAVLISFLTAASGVASADPAATIPLDISTLILSSQFAQTVSQLSISVAASGRSIRLANCSSMKLGSQDVVSCELDQKLKTDINGAWSAVGEIVGYITQGPTGELSVTGCYFKPATSDPGGASVGNR